MKVFINALLVVAFQFAGSGFVAKANDTQEPIEIIIPTPAGGATDVLGRLIAEQLPAWTGRSVMVTNRSGGGMSIGARHVANSKPDGGTILVISLDGILLQQALQSSAPKLEEFRFLAIASVSYSFLYASSKHDWTSLQDFIVAARKEPGRYSIGIVSGSPQQIAARQIQKLAGISLIEVPFKGESDTKSSIAGGHVDVGFSTNPAAMSDATKFKIFAVRAPTRLSDFPDIPTLKESGLDVAPLPITLLFLRQKIRPTTSLQGLRKQFPP